MKSREGVRGTGSRWNSLVVSVGKKRRRASAVA
jgi:hypothetical protein